ncbi:MAG: hypothetical protein EOM15_12000, partial [Spirochaetia bacterium]|nr:hypothetical protein [Spirochaetia bacterium]
MKTFGTLVHENRDLLQQNLKLSFLEQALPVIEPGTTYTIITQKVINPYGFILEAIKQRGIIDELIIATYSINPKTLSIICNLLDNKQVTDFT